MATKTLDQDGSFRVLTGGENVTPNVGVALQFTVTGTNSFVLGRNTAPPGSAVTLMDIPYTAADGETIAAGVAMTTSQLVYLRAEDAATDVYVTLAWTSGSVVVNSYPIGLNRTNIDAPGSPFSQPT